MEVQYRTPKGEETTFFAEELRAEKAILFAEDLMKVGRLKDVLFIDMEDSSWTLKELKKYLKGMETEPHQISVYFDGGFDLGKKRSGLGCVIYFEQNGKHYRIRKNALVEELETNNEAEYAALHLGLKELETLGVHHQTVRFIGDSQVVINQLNGEWPCYEKDLSRWADRIEEKMEKMGIRPEYEAITRKKNQEADHLASQALDGIDISSKIEVKS